MSHPTFILVPWCVFAVAVGWKAARLVWAFNTARPSQSRSLEHVRAVLERNWQRDQWLRE